MNAVIGIIGYENSDQCLCIDPQTNELCAVKGDKPIDIDGDYIRKEYKTKTELLGFIKKITNHWYIPSDDDVDANLFVTDKMMDPFQWKFNDEHSFYVLQPEMRDYLEFPNQRLKHQEIQQLHLIKQKYCYYIQHIILPKLS